MPRTIDPSALVRKAIDVTGLSDRQFAMTLLLVDERTVRHWLAGDRAVPGPVLVICRAIIDHPVVWRALSRAAGRLSSTT